MLLATSSFWQGVDVVGDALSCVIIDKLPFASPGDPITAARVEAIGARGGSPFGEYQIPLAILALKQGLGRLLRHRQDRGVLAVLDPRLVAAAGARSLTLDDVARFFERPHGALRSPPRLLGRSVSASSIECDAATSTSSRPSPPGAGSARWRF